MRSRSVKMAIIVAFAVALVLPMASPALAQTSSDVFADTVIQIQIWPEAEPDSTIIIVGAVIPTDTPLPVTVEFPVPADAEVLWAGEVAGDAVENDIQRTPEIVEVEGGRVVRFEVETYRTVQYEAFLTPPALDGDRISQTVDWVQTVPSAEVSIAWRIPANTTDVELDPEAPAAPAVNELGEKLYTLRSVALEPGASASFAASYAYIGAEDTSSGGIGILPIIIGLLVVAVIVLIVVLVRQMPPATHDEVED